MGDRMRLRRRELCLLALTATVSLAACGSGEDAVEPTPARPGAVEFDVDSKNNKCPAFTYYAVTPLSIPPLTPADIQVSVFDPENRELRLRWSATSGYFLAKNSASTQYACNRTGVQTLTLSATDVLDCERHIDLNVTCLDE